MGWAITTRTRQSKGRAFIHRTYFCDEIGVSHTLNSVANQEAKHLFLIVYCVRYRAHGARNKPVRASTVLEQIESVCSEIITMGGSNPRCPEHAPNVAPPPQYASWVEYCTGLQKEDGPSSRAHPVNITILRALIEVLDHKDPEFGVRWSHIIDLAVVAFYWLLRPCEVQLFPYLGGPCGRLEAARHGPPPAVRETVGIP